MSIQRAVYLAPSYCRLAIHTCTADFCCTLALHTRGTDLHHGLALPICSH